MAEEAGKLIPNWSDLRRRPANTRLMFLMPPPLRRVP